MIGWPGDAGVAAALRRRSLRRQGSCRKSRRVTALVATLSIATALAVALPSPRVYARQPPVARLTATPQIGSAPLAVAFDGSASSENGGSIASWSLAFGDASPTISGSGQPPTNTATHTYISGG